MQTNHGSPFDRGQADKYYGRRFNPHYRHFVNGALVQTFEHHEMTPEQIAEYAQGYEQEESSKDYGKDNALDIVLSQLQTMHQLRFGRKL